MKNIFTTIALTLLFSMFIPSFSQTSAKELYQAKDANKDGVVDIADMSLTVDQNSTSSTLQTSNSDNSILDLYNFTNISTSFKKTSFGVGIAARQYISLRTTPDVSSDTNIIAVLNQSDRFFIVEDLGEWYRIKYNDNGTLKEGYVYSLYTAPLRDDYLDSYLGFISSKYEATVFKGSTITSVRNPATISDNAGDKGGKSYGMYQLSSSAGTVDVFLNYLSTNPEGKDFYDELSNAKIADGDKYSTKFDEVWKHISTNHLNEFLELQHKFIKIKYYDASAVLLKDKYNFDISVKSLALKEVLWSTAVQYGVKGNGTTTIGAIDMFYEAGLNRDEADLITRIYDLKTQHAKSINSDVLKKRASSEKNDILYMYNSYKEIAK